jgi:cation diffusion facilitator family transporter
MSTSGGTRAVIAALGANLGIAVLKFAAFALTRSSSMLAEGIHSVADSGNQVLLLVGGRRARREATPEHPFGYGRERYLYAFLVSVVLFTVGGLFALYEAYHKAHEVAAHPHDLGQLDGRWWWVPIVVLVGAIVMESLSFRTAIGEANQVRGETGWVQFVRRAKAPELPVILLEDFAALLGLGFALFGVGLTLLTKNPVFDVVGTALIGLLLVAVAVVLSLETRSLLLGEAASPDVQRRIGDALTATDGIDRIIHMRTLHLGPEELLVCAKVAVTATDSAGAVAAAIDRAEVAIRQAEPTARVIYL